MYGTLLDDARRLYIFDGIALREYAYELDGTGAGRATAIADEDRVRGQRAIRETVEGIARLYRYRPEQPALTTAETEASLAVAICDRDRPCPWRTRAG